MSLGFNTRSLMFANAQSVAVGTASATQSAALPAGAVAVRICAAPGGFYNFVGSAAAGTGSYLPPNTVEYVEIGGESRISFIATTSANPNVLNIIPCAS